MPDPFPEVSGGGLAQLRAAGLALDVGVESAAAERLNAPYLKRLATGRPYVIAKWAMTLDGKIATGQGNSQWISSPRSRALVHELRGRVDAILIGIETALADNPQLTARPGGPRVAARVVLDSRARLPHDGRLAATAREVPVWVAVTERAPADRREHLSRIGCQIMAFPGEGPVPIGLLLDELGRRDVTNLLVEGGGRVTGSFFDAGEVDAVDVFVAPLIEGGTHGFGPVRGAGVARMAAALRLESLRWSTVDGDLRLEGTIARPWSPPRAVVVAP
jgi:diaminohydroxyphosphoribosylaminopyrimidine deaminase/5-amino-6-(5-phosphoribosylamino)uracil reductase